MPHFFRKVFIEKNSKKCGIYFNNEDVHCILTPYRKHLQPVLFCSIQEIFKMLIIYKNRSCKLRVTEKFGVEVLTTTPLHRILCVKYSKK